jgi:hypothetical protein
LPTLTDLKELRPRDGLVPNTLLALARDLLEMGRTTHYDATPPSVPYVSVLPVSSYDVR